MENKQIAELTNKAFNLLLDKTTSEASRGSNKAALDVLRQMTARNLALRALGYYLTDSGELTTKRPPADPLVELARRAAKGDTDAAERLLESLS